MMRWLLAFILFLKHTLKLGACAFVLLKLMFVQLLRVVVKKSIKHTPPLLHDSPALCFVCYE